MKKLCVIILLIVSSYAAICPCGGAYADEIPALSDDEIVLISKAVRLETQGKSYLSKVCVTAMIFNRIRDSLLPNGVYATVMQKGAFLVADPDTIRKDVSADELEEYTILTELVYKFGIDPTCGALFIMEEGDPDIELFTVTLKVEGLVFAKP